MTKQRGFSLRHELKFRLDPMQYQVLKKNVSTVLSPDPHMGSAGCYQVKNLYFDDFRNSAFFEKQAGVARRKKYRLRIYNNSDSVIKFERKTKFDHYILKESTKLTRSEADRIIAGDIDFLDDSESKLLKEFALECKRNLMRPVVVLEYKREAYVHPVGNVRITFDSELRTGLGLTSFFDCNTCTMSAINANEVILEIKYNEVIPRHICGLFLDTIQPRAAIGKFAICRTQQVSRIGGLANGFPCVKKDKNSSNIEE